MKKQEVEIFEALKSHIGKYPSERQAAFSLSITPSYLNDIMNGRRGISAKIARKIGFRKVTSYEKI